MIHIVICDNKTKELDKIINKERTILLRGNDKRRIPNSRIFINDELYFVNKGENEAQYHAVVTNADSFRGLTEMEIERIIDNIKDNLNLTKSEEEKWKKKCLCIIEFTDLKSIEPISVPQYSPIVDWIMVNDLSELNKN